MTALFASAADEVHSVQVWSTKRQFVMSWCLVQFGLFYHFWRQTRVKKRPPGTLDLPNAGVFFLPPSAPSEEAGFQIQLSSWITSYTNLCFEQRKEIQNNIRKQKHFRSNLITASKARKTSVRGEWRILLPEAQCLQAAEYGRMACMSTERKTKSACMKTAG